MFRGLDPMEMSSWWAAACHNPSCWRIVEYILPFHYLETQKRDVTVVVFFKGKDYPKMIVITSFPSSYSCEGNLDKALKNEKTAYHKRNRERLVT